MSEATAKRLWTELQACLPSHYRTLDWENLPQGARGGMTRVVAEFVQNRDFKVIAVVKRQILEEYRHCVTRDRPERFGAVIRAKRIELPEID